MLALIGYHPDYDFLRSMGIELSEQQCRPVCDPVSLESNVRGIYVAGVIVAGSRTNEIFIENGRFHGKQIADDLEAQAALFMKTGKARRMLSGQRLLRSIRL